jgi:hypothetical protein
LAHLFAIYVFLFSYYNCLVSAANSTFCIKVFGSLPVVNQRFGTNICPFFRVITLKKGDIDSRDNHLVDLPEEGTDISPETLVSCQRMTPGNNTKTFIQDNNYGESL